MSKEAALEKNIYKKVFEATANIKFGLLQPRDILSHLRAFGKCFFAIFQKKSDFSFLFSSFGLPAQILCRTHNFPEPLPVENRATLSGCPKKAPVIQNLR